MTTCVLGALSVKGRPPLPRPTDGFLRRRHHHPAGTRCVELRQHEREPQPDPMTPPPAPAWLPAPVTDPALEA
jgi:hypothetical protein